MIWCFRKCSGRPESTRRRIGAGFHAVVGNPPWDMIQPLAKEFYASIDLRILDAATQLERGAVEKRDNRSGHRPSLQGLCCGI